MLTLTDCFLYNLCFMTTMVIQGSARHEVTKMRLTDAKIRSLPIPPKGQKTYWEQGFGLRVSQGGSKTFVAKVTGRQVTIGKYPSVSLREARRASLELKVAPPSVTSLQSLTEARTAYLKECEQKNRPATIKSYRHFLGQVDRKRLSDIHKSDVDLSSPHAVTAWKVFFNWCIRNELVERNPFIHVAAKYGERSRVLSPDELREIWKYNWPPYSDYLKLQILTGQRIGQWKDYSYDRDTITFPASVMKGKVEHVIPLTESVAELLPIPTFSGWSKGKARIDRHVPISPWQVHDLRRTFSTICASLQIPLHVTEQMLAHRSGSISGVAATYNRYNYLIEMRTALENYEKHVHLLVT